MPKQMLTKDPTEISGLTADINYTVQLRASLPAYIQTASTPPTDGSSAFILSPMSWAVIKKTGTDNIYVWQDSDLGYGSIVYEKGV